MDFYLDNEGLLCVGGRIFIGDVLVGFNGFIIVLKKLYVVRLFIKYYY